MARGLTAAALAAIDSGTFRPVLFFESAWADTTIRVWSGIGTISWNGLNWVGVGDFGSIQPPSETTDTAATGFTATLSSINPSLVSEALAQARRGLSGKVWLGFMDAVGNIIADPYLSCGGRLDQPTVDQNPAGAQISITYENRLINLETPRERRYTSADQQTDFPNDKGFDFVPSIQDWNNTWGNSG